ncbi:MAG: DUF4912 domain-containing protein, partial [Blastocatellia bacterium]|nr:DUF4912 domain-containing protein [Blastocatellia bacterium]
MPFFFDLSSLIPTEGRNPFEPVVVEDEVPAVVEVKEEVPAEPIVDTGLPIPSQYDFDIMQALVQDPFRIYVYWHLKENPFDRLSSIFPENEVGNFHSTLKLIDETNNISVYFEAAFLRDYWFNVYPDRQYRIELGVRSPVYGYIKLLSSQSVLTPRDAPSEQIAEETEYQVTADEFLQVLRESHFIAERAYTLEGLLPGDGAVPPGARISFWDSLPVSFRRVIRVIADVQAGRDYDRWWERSSREELAEIVREFLDVIRDMGDGELGYMLLLRHLPELLRRSIQSEGIDGAGREIQIDKPMSLYFAERLGQGSSEM